MDTLEKLDLLCLRKVDVFNAQKMLVAKLLLLMLGQDALIFCTNRSGAIFVDRRCIVPSSWSVSVHDAEAGVSTNLCHAISKETDHS